MQQHLLSYVRFLIIVCIIRVPLLETLCITSSVNGCGSNRNNLSNAQAYNFTESYKYAADIEINCNEFTQKQRSKLQLDYYLNSAIWYLFKFEKH